MAKLFLVPVNLNKNELQNARVQNLASAPGTPVEGQIYYDTATFKLYVRNNSAWVACDGSGLLGQANTWTANQTINASILGNGVITLTGTSASSVAGTFQATQHIATGQTGAATSTKYAGGNASGAPGSGAFSTGDWTVTTGGDIYICTAGGSPGTWARVGSYLLGATNSWSAQNTFTGGVVVNTTGITGNKEINLTGTGSSAVAGTFQATQHIATGQTGATTSTKYGGGTASAAPGSGTWTTGDWVVATGGDIFVCSSGGTPGTWVRVGSYLLGGTNSWTAQNTFTGGVVVNTTGITGNKEINLTGTGTSGVAGTFTSTAVIASGLTGATQASRYVGATASGAPGSGTFVIGDFIVDRSGSFWICTTGGSPGTWAQLTSSSLTASSSVTSETSFGSASNAGSAGTYSKGDHTHGTPTHDGSAHSAISISSLSAPTGDVAWGSHKITGLLDPTGNQDAATKAYVDATSAGIDFKASVRAATTGVLANTPNYSNGTNGVGATLTSSSNAAFPTIDGVTLAQFDRILVKDQASAFQNGIYTLTTVGSGAVPWVLTRATDNDTSSAPVEVSAGNLVYVEPGGTANGGQQWVMTQTAAITMGTTALTWVLYFTATSTQAGDGLTASGNVLAVGAGTGITVNANDVAISTSVVVRKYAADVGNGALTSISVTHNLGTKDVTVAVYDNTSPYAEVECDVQHTDTNNVTLVFTTAPTSNQYRCVVHA